MPNNVPTNRPIRNRVISFLLSEFDEPPGRKTPAHFQVSRGIFALWRLRACEGLHRIYQILIALKLIALIRNRTAGEAAEKKHGAVSRIGKGAGADIAVGGIAANMICGVFSAPIQTVPCRIRVRQGTAKKGRRPHSAMERLMRMRCFGAAAVMKPPGGCHPDGFSPKIRWGAERKISCNPFCYSTDDCTEPARKRHRTVTRPEKEARERFFREDHDASFPRALFSGFCVGSVTVFVV